MIFHRHGITLRSIQEKDIEKIRIWRNADEIREKMDYKKIITPEEQTEWFKNLDLTRNYFFIIQVGEKEIGVVNVKDIDWDKAEGEAGIFIVEEGFLRSPVPVFSVLALMDFSFFILNLKFLKAKILHSQDQNINFNLGLGYKPKSEDKDFNLYQVELPDYLEKTMDLRSYSLKRFNNETRLTMENTDMDFHHSLLKKINKTTSKELSLKIINK